MNGDAPRQTRESWREADNHIREVLALELMHRDKALAKQAQEYERRLDGLNNENQRILEAAALSVSNEKFDGYIRNIEEWRDEVNKFRTATETAALVLSAAQSRLRTTVLAWIAVATLIEATVFAILRGST